MSDKIQTYVRKLEELSTLWRELDPEEQLQVNGWITAQPDAYDRDAAQRHLACSLQILHKVSSHLDQSLMINMTPCSLVVAGADGNNYTFTLPSCPWDKAARFMTEPKESHESQK